MFKRVCSAAAALLFALALLTPSAANAQENRRFEAFGGFSYLIADVGGSGVGLNDVSGPGFTGEFAFFLNHWLAVGAEVGYNTGTLDLPRISVFPLDDIHFSQWTVLFGPRFGFAESERFRVGAQAMVGIARGSTDVDFDPEELIVEVPGQGPFRFNLRAFDIHVEETTFAALFGVHFDLRINERLIWRVVQPDVLVTGYGNDGQAHFRISTGLGFEF